MDDKKAFVTTVATQHGRRLRRFLAARVRNAADLPDIVQEVYLRLLRVERYDRIRSPEAYLFTLASHVLYQHALKRSSTPVIVEFADIVGEPRALEEDDPALRAETELRIQELERAIAQLSPKVRAALLLHRRDGYSLEEIGAQLGVSRNMAKKYLAKGLLYCRQQLHKDA